MKYTPIATRKANGDARSLLVDQGMFDDRGTGSITNASFFGDSRFVQIVVVVVALSQYRELHETRQPRGVLGRSEPTITNQ